MCFEFAPACITHSALQRLQNPTLGIIGQCRRSPTQRGERRQYMQYGIWVQFELCAGKQEKAAADNLSPIFLCQLSHFHIIPRNRVTTGQYTLNNKRQKKVMGSGSEHGGVSMWRAGPFFKHTLELRFKRQIFMIFIVDYIYQKGFLKIGKILVPRLSFN